MYGIALLILLHLIPANVSSFQLITPFEGTATLTRQDAMSWNAKGKGMYDNALLKVDGAKIKTKAKDVEGEVTPDDCWGLKPDTKWDSLSVLKVDDDKFTITKGTNSITVEYQEGKEHPEKLVASWTNSKK